MKPADFSSFAKVEWQAPLAEKLVYRIGGPAEVLIEATGEEEILRLVEICREKNFPLTVLGAGSNLLVRDGGIRGVVLRLAGAADARAVKILEENSESVLLRAPVSCAKAALLELALENSWSGLEFSAGIPGALGGAIYMNAGTKWGSYGEVIEKVRLLVPGQGVVEKTREEMAFKYRGHGEGMLQNGTLALSADVRLRKGEPAEKIRALVDEILTYRGSKQPLELPNCGSVFKNPSGSTLGAGRLIEACGLKGRRRGQAMVSLKHANFILNLGGTLARDVEGLIAEIQAEVFKARGVFLEKEVIILGEAI